MIWQYGLLTWAVWNVMVFTLYGVEKWKAKRQKWRISEMTLLGMAFVFGASGAFAGMLLFHHKTRKWKFRILVPLFLLLQAAGGYWILR